MIPQSNPHAGYSQHHAEILEALIQTLDTGHFILGPETARFEDAFSAFLGGGETIGVGNGTDALAVALMACGVKPGDAVVTVAHTAVATVAAIEMARAVPVFADISPEDCTLDPVALEQTIRDYSASENGSKHPLKAVIAVHLYGHPARLPEISRICREHGLLLIEDCAQSHGASCQGRMTGLWGDAAAFSFYPTKNLGAFGDGGAVVTSSAKTGAQARLLRQYGWEERYISEIAGFNSRLDELHAAVLRVRLQHLHQENASRQTIAKRYSQQLGSLPLQLPAIRPECTHVFHQYAVRCAERDRLRHWLRERGVHTLVHYPMPVHLQPAYAGRVFLPKGGLPETERAAREVLSLPMFPQLREEQANQVTTAIRDFFC